MAVHRKHSVAAAEHKALKAGLLKKQIQQSRRYRWFGLVFGFVCLPYWVLLYSFSRSCLFLGTPWSKKIAVAYLRHYARWLLFIKGLHSQAIRPLPSLKPGALWLVLRQDMWLTLLLIKLFAPDMILPCPAQLYKVKAIPFIPFLILKPFLNCCTYPDAPLPYTLPTIIALREAGYAVAVHPNEGQAYTTFETILYLYSDLRYILNDVNNTVALCVHHWDFSAAASFLTPQFMRLDAQPYTEFHSHIGALTITIQLRIMAEFFHFKYVKEATAFKDAPKITKTVNAKT